MAVALAITTGFCTMTTQAGAIKTEQISVDNFFQTTQPAIVLPNGNMITTQQHRNGYNDYSPSYRLLNPQLTVVEESVFDMHADIVWMSANPNGDVWLFNRESELGAWNTSSNTLSKITLNFNDEEDTGIVNTNNHFVIFDHGAEELIEYDNQLNKVNYLSYRSCTPIAGYFKCTSSSGADEYIDANNFTIQSDESGFTQRTAKYTYEISNNNTIISDSNGSVVFNFPVAPGAIPIAFADNMIAFKANGDKLILTDWQGNTLDTIDGISIPKSATFHPAGFFVYEDYRTRYIQFRDDIEMTNFATMDYLNSNNPELINDYAITVNGDTGGTPDTGGGTNTGGTPTTPASSSGGSGGSMGYLSLGLLAFLGLKRRYVTR